MGAYSGKGVTSTVKIAIPVSDGQVANHLGHAEKFLIADVDGGAVVARAEHPNPGHGPGGPPPVYLARQGVTHVVAWGMPEHARGIFAHFGIQVTLGATGEPDRVLRDFLAGTLTLTTEGLDAGGSCRHDH